MERRFLPALVDHRGRSGAFATKWRGWVNPRLRVIYFDGRVNPSNPSNIDKVESRVGCYAMLYRPGPQRLYTIYVGFSTNLWAELRARIRGWGIDSSSYRFTAIYIPSSAMAKAYEEDLIRYYAPLWNRRFTDCSCEFGSYRTELRKDTFKRYI